MIDALQAQFEIPGAVAVMPGNNGLPKVRLTHASGATAEVYLHGGHVTSWRNADGQELFFLSDASYFEPGRPIRGGIPVIFPQFGGGPLPSHGFARTSEWTLASTILHDDGKVSCTLELSDSPATLAIWPYPFTLRLIIDLSNNRLQLAIEVTNTGEQPFDFNIALHTYFAVADISRMVLYGLEGVTYIDSLRNDVREVETRKAIRFDTETDRIYVSAPFRQILEDEVNRRWMIISESFMHDKVVWNPWIAKAQRMPDFGDEEYRRMVCVETGKIAQKQLLQPGTNWQGITIFLHDLESMDIGRNPDLVL